VSPSARSLLGDLASNYAYMALMAFVTLFLVPIYVRALGSQWSAVAICLTIQNFLFLMDVALAPAMLRDVARADVHEHAPALYRHYLRFYAGLGLLTFVIAQLVVQILENTRAGSGTPLSSDMLLALRLALVQFLFQFANNAATGYWSGQGRLRYANLRLAGFALAKHAAALLLVTQWHSASVYMLPFATISLIEFAANYRLLRGARAPSSVVGASGNLAGWRDMAGFAAAAALGIATVQIDRIYLSFALPADRYGTYYLLTSLMMSFFSLQPPIYRAFWPRVATAASPRLQALSMLKLHLVLIVLPTLVVAAFPETILYLWLHNADIAKEGALPFRMLMLAVAMNAIFAPAGMLLVNSHRYRAIAIMNILILCGQALALFTLTPRLGMSAGGCAWLVCGVIQLTSAGWMWRSRVGDERAKF
jgi:O-antigen/teichoic acid export membrane protein